MHMKVLMQIDCCTATFLYPYIIYLSTAWCPHRLPSYFSTDQVMAISPLTRDQWQPIYWYLAIDLLGTLVLVQLEPLYETTCARNELRSRSSCTDTVIRMKNVLLWFQACRCAEAYKPLEMHVLKILQDGRYTEHIHVCLFPDMFSLPRPPPNRPLPTRRGGSHLQCQKSHPRPPTTTPLWPETARWRARRNSGRRPGGDSWPPRGQHPSGKTRPRRAPTASRFTSPRLRQGYEDTQYTGKHCAIPTQRCMLVHAKVYGCNQIPVLVLFGVIFFQVITNQNTDLIHLLEKVHSADPISNIK